LSLSHPNNPHAVFAQAAVIPGKEVSLFPGPFALILV